jgi:hypothetical protein
VVEFIPLVDPEEAEDPEAAEQAAQEDLEDHQEQTDSAEAEAEVLTQLLLQEQAETE